MLHGRGPRAPTKARGQTGLPLPLSVSPLYGEAARQECSCSPVATPHRSCLSYKDPGSLHVRWIHSGFGAEVLILLRYISDLESATRLKRRSSSQPQPQFIVQHPRDRSFCLRVLEGNPAHCIQLRIRARTGWASGFSFQTTVSLKPFPLTLIFL